MPQLKDANDYMSEFGWFEKVKTKRSERPDVHALIVLSEIDARDRLAGDQRGIDLISYGSMEAITIAVNPNLTVDKETLIDLVRCGVVFEDDTIRIIL